jgi:hypothetical protein
MGPVFAYDENTCEGKLSETAYLITRTSMGSCGSADLTRRNLSDYNLEAGLLVRASDGLGVQAVGLFRAPLVERRRAVLSPVCGLCG